jgi:hypothetical protein
MMERCTVVDRRVMVQDVSVQSGVHALAGSTCTPTISAC